MQQLVEEFLRQILGVFGAMATVADIAVKGIPVGAAKLFQGGGALRRILVRRSEHNAPMRGGEQWLTHRAWGVLCLPPHHGGNSTPVSKGGKAKTSRKSKAFLFVPGEASLRLTLPERAAILLCWQHGCRGRTGDREEWLIGRCHTPPLRQHPLQNDGRIVSNADPVHLSAELVFRIDGISARELEKTDGLPRVRELTGVVIGRALDPDRDVFDERRRHKRPPATQSISSRRQKAGAHPSHLPGGVEALGGFPYIDPVGINAELQQQMVLKLMGPEGPSFGPDRAGPLRSLSC